MHYPDGPALYLPVERMQHNVINIYGAVLLSLINQFKWSHLIYGQNIPNNKRKTTETSRLRKWISSAIAPADTSNISVLITDEKYISKRHMLKTRKWIWHSNRPCKRSTTYISNYHRIISYRTYWIYEQKLSITWPEYWLLSNILSQILLNNSMFSQQIWY